MVAYKWASIGEARSWTDYSGEIIMMYMPREEGQGLVEYALILVLVAVVVIVILALLGPAIGNIFSNIVNAL
jgi:pilus assembly protein Flp/PilA